MIRSIWRYSHLTLALISGLFLVLASVTGIILAFEPLKNAVKPYQPEKLSEITLAETIRVLQTEYDEVLSLKVDANDFLLVAIVTKEGDSKSVYIHPKTGAILGKPEPQHPIFQFATNLHRSLFLKGIGRFFIGFVSFLLFFIAFTGILLLIKRQGGLTKLFSKVHKDRFETQYHVVLSKWFFVPIIIISITGVYLSAEKFQLLPNTRVNHQIMEPEIAVDMSIAPSELLLFQKITLDQVRSVTFPFSEFPEDYFELALKKRELYVHQYTGAILSEQQYPFTFLASGWSLVLHTGQGSIWWSLVLLLSSCAILFFVYSGFVIWRRRVNSVNAVTTTIDKDDCSHIILVGSETGTTYGFARALEQGLTKAGKSVLITELNAYDTYPKAEQLIFLTATYGEGEAPSNAHHFKNLFDTKVQPKGMHYCVVGFGSLLYPNYCQFATALEKWLSDKDGFTAVLPLYKINNQSQDAFLDWVRQWSKAIELSLEVSLPKKKKRKTKQREFEVFKRTALNLDDTFLLHLTPKKKLRYQSGDLWEFTPEDGIPRQYSIAKYEEGVLLSIKRHEFGICSTLLSRQSTKDILKGGIKRNGAFHFPKNAPAVVCIGNGTGIAPFLGIIDENTNKIPLDLYWGGRTQASYELYANYLSKAKSQHKVNNIHLALSQEGKKTYVQDLLLHDKDKIANYLKDGAVFMVCGAIAMQREVLAVLEDISASILQQPLSDFEHNEQLRMDCY